MKALFLTLLISSSVMAAKLPMTCYKKVFSPECNFFSHDPLVSVSKQYWVTCKGSIVGKNYNNQTVSRPVYRQKNYTPNIGILGGVFQKIGLASELKESMNIEIDTVITNMDKCE